MSEEYCQRLTPNSFPVNGAVGACVCMFKNLKKDEIEGDTYIVVRVIRHGDMILDENERSRGTSSNVTNLVSNSSLFSGNWGFSHFHRHKNRLFGLSTVLSHGLTFLKQKIKTIEANMEA